MNKKFLTFGLLGLATAASAATAVVWDSENEPDMEPAYSFTFKYGTGASIDTTNVSGTKVLDFTAKAGATSNGAGYGFGWKQDASWKDVPITLAAYKGVCLTYKAEMPFRVDFKQSTITDDNYYGMELAASSVFKKQFIAFSELKQGWKSSTTVAWNVSRQLGVQFGFKNTHATAASNTNEVMLQSFVLADECVTFAPVIKGGHTAVESAELVEGDTLKIPMSELFSDEDGDPLTVTLTLPASGEVVDLGGKTSYTDMDMIMLATKPNPTDGAEAVVKITATDPAKKSVTYTLNLTLVDRQNKPVAKDFAFEVLEDSSYKNGLSSRLTSLGFDADGDAIALELVSEPEHGTLDLNTSTGIFTYVPEKDFFGKDAFAYRFVEKENPESVSNIGTASITVVNVNDVPVVKVLSAVYIDEVGEEHEFGDTLTVDEDFASFIVMVPKTNISIVDADGDDDYKVSAKVSAVANASLVDDGENYVIEVSAKRDSSGTAKVNLAVTDPKITISNNLFVLVVNPTPDAPVAKDDSYEVIQDSLNTIAAKTGVLANDVNPDGESALVAVLEIEPEHGKLELAEDGSFTYESDAGYEGEDAFAYKTVNEAGLESEMAVVTLNVLYKNKAPEVVEGVLDTVGTRLAALREDFTTTIRFTKTEIQSWFADDQDAATALTYTVRSDDSLLAPTIASGVISIKAVKDACGEANVIVTAKDKGGAATDLLIPAVIECVNDKPVALASDTVYIKFDTAWTVTIDMYDYVTDVDGDTLVFTPNLTPTMAKRLDVAIDGSMLTLSAKEDVEYVEGNVFGIGVKAADAATYVTANVYVRLGEKPTTAIAPVIAAPKANWQNAITASRGKVALFDMQGRVMWSAKLPVSESEVRAAAEGVQGRKILQVNKQVFTIK